MTPDGFDLSLGQTTLVGFLYATARTAGFVLTAPPFNTRAIPARARATVALGLAIPLTSFMSQSAVTELNTTELPLRIILQTLTGVTMGFFVQLAVTAVQMLGDIIDVVGGFTMTMAMDPLLLTQTSVMGRLHQLMAITLLFFADGHLLILRGLSRSAELMPDPRLDLSAMARVVAADLSSMFMAAVQIAAPIIGALLLADVALGLLTRAAPALNAFSLAFPLKITLTLLLIGLIIVQVPDFLERVVEQAVVTIVRLSGGG